MTDEDLPIAYVPNKSRNIDEEALRARIPGWGSDSAREDRPQVPRLTDPTPAPGAHWEFPSRQPGGEGRERSVEHAFLTPVFGTAQPLSGPAAILKRIAYSRYSEGRLAHWMLLILGDRVDVMNHRVRDALAGHPDRLIKETGIQAEAGNQPIRSRVSSSRADTSHMWMDPLLTNWPWLAAAATAWLVVRRLRRR
jgi:hypothetical protein